MFSKILSKVAVFCVLFFSFVFVGCGESESELKNLALERCQKNAESALNNKYYPFEKLLNTEIISFEKIENEKRKTEYYDAECKIHYTLSRDYGDIKKGENYFRKDSIRVKKVFDNATGEDKWVAN